MAGSFHEEKRAAREALHEHLSRAARYYPDADDLATYQDVSVRLHYKFDTLGEMKGTSFDFAERHETIPKVIFDKREVVPVTHAVVSFGMGEAYQVDSTEPTDDFTITAHSPRMSQSKANGYPGPESGGPAARMTESGSSRVTE